jgi:hypothetical protein
MRTMRSTRPSVELDEAMAVYAEAAEIVERDYAITSGAAAL